MQSSTALLATELVRLVRGLRELGGAVRVAGGAPLELAAAQVLGRVGDEGPLRLTALAERLGLDLSTVSRQVPGLEAAGWLDREADPRDRRAQLLRLTEAGQQALRERRAMHAQILREALPAWEDAQLHDLAASLARLNTDLSAYRAQLSRPGLPATVVPEAS